MSQSQTKALVIGVGAERGLGAALASLFAREGHHVVVAGRALDRVENAARTIGEGGRAEHFGVDATSEADVRAVFDRASPRVAAILRISLSFNAGANTGLPGPMNSTFGPTRSRSGRRSISSALQLQKGSRHELAERYP
jgi:NAD(P)-dependent dehydrogenase (short-subunit alcohol dehydrogenase family)